MDGQGCPKQLAVVQETAGNGAPVHPQLCLKRMVAEMPNRNMALSFAWLKALLPHGLWDALKDHRTGEYSLHQEN